MKRYRKFRFKSILNPVPKSILSFIFLAIVTGCATTHVGPIDNNSQTESIGKVERSDLKIMSWNIKHLGRENLDYDSSIKLIRTAEIIAIQEVNKTKSGADALNKLSGLLEKAIGEKVCQGISEVPTGSTERYAFLWRNTKVSFVKSNGEILEDCPVKAIVISLNSIHADKIIREPASATFQIKGTKKHFTLASVHLVPTAKKPANEVPWLFKSLKNIEGPIVLVGDFNLPSYDMSFDTARELGFNSVFGDVKTSLKMKERSLNEPYDNLWIKNAQFEAPLVVNPYNELPDVPQKKIYNNISDHSPITAVVGF